MNLSSNRLAETSEIAQKLSQSKGFPAEPPKRSEAWYRKRRELLQQQKVALMSREKKAA